MSDTQNPHPTARKAADDKAATKAAQAERVAAALRANLFKRKAQARARAAGAAESPEAMQESE